MTDLYLIAHKVRGEPAFDVATRMECPLCAQHYDSGIACVECEDGYWWVIPTSGHRAYPYYEVPLTNLLDSADEARVLGSVIEYAPQMPSDWPDHYKIGPAPKINITSLLPKAQTPTIRRRI